MLYVKYRPKSFQEIIRPNLEVDNLLSKLKSGTLGHAHILAGSRGVGKTTVARLLASGLNCLQLKDDLCGVCENCKSIKDGSFIDIIEIDGASNRKIEDARELREQIKFPPLKGKKKVIIIDEAHMLTNEAFNALLKSIEEPPEYIVFILCTTEVQKIPETIRSRCQISFLSRPSDSQIIEKLKLITKAEKIDLPDYDLEMIARSANGGFRDAETLLTQIQGGVSGDILENYYSYKNFIKYLTLILKKDLHNLLKFHHSLEEKGIDLTKWLGLYISFLRSCLYLGLEKYVSRENKFNPEDKEEIKILLGGKGIKELSSHILDYIDLYSRIRYSQTPNILIEIHLINTLEMGQEIFDINIEEDLREAVGKNKIKMEEKKQPQDETKTAVVEEVGIKINVENKTKDIPENNKITHKKDEKAHEVEKDFSGNSAGSSYSLEGLEGEIGDEESEGSFEGGLGDGVAEVLEGTSKTSATNNPINNTPELFIKTSDPESSLSLDSIKESWAQVLAEVLITNKPLESILRQATLVSFDGQTILLESPYKFHSERLSLNSNKLILEEIMIKIFNQKILYRCSLSSVPKVKKNMDDAFSTGESLTDYNVTAPENLTDGDLLSLFNGGVPVTR